MSSKPIFVATHPRACSTAFERVFMTRRDTLQCIHEPFGDAFYYGPERLSARYEDDEQARIQSGFSQSTFKTIFDRIERESLEGKRIFIKDIIHYLVPPNGKPASIAPSLARVKRGIGTTSNGVEQINGHGISNNHQHPVEEGDRDDGVAVPVNGYHHHQQTTTTPAPKQSNKKTPYPYDTEPEPGNPTVVPTALLSQFHFTFLIRDPHYSIPSYFRCTIPPLDEVTGFYNFDPSEAGYDEVRRVFEYLREIHLVGPKIATDGIDDDAPPRLPSSNGVNGSVTNGTTNTTTTPAHTNGSVTTNGATLHQNRMAEEREGRGEVEICVLDADDLLDNPEGMIRAFCHSTGIEYTPDMLNWDNEEDHAYAKAAFEKWKGFHEDAIDSKALTPRSHEKQQKTEAEFDAEWREKYGPKGAKIIRETVDRNMEDYLYMKKYTLKV